MEFYKKRMMLFNPRLLKAFYKMILGINVEVTPEERASNGCYEGTGRWFYILSIAADETVTIRSTNHMVISGVNLNDLKLNDLKI